MEPIPDSHRDLLEGRFATLATVGAAGRPQQSVVWFLAEGNAVKISLNSNRQKTRNLQRNPVCSLLIADPANPYRYLELRGTAKVEADPDYSFANQVGAKFGDYPHKRDRPGETRVVVTVVPDRARAVG